MEREYGRSRKKIEKNHITDKIFIRTLRRTIASMALCTVCLISGTWAWFVASAESTLPVISFGELTETVVSASKSRSLFRKSAIRQNKDGKYELEAGEYVISIDPLYGSAPVYCLIEVEAQGVSEEKIEEAIDLFNEDMEEKWIPIFASDSNSIMVLENEEELEAYQLEIEENNEEFEYDILPFAVVNDGIYRVDWEPEEERTFTLTLEADAMISISTFWLTEDANEEEYLELDELMGWNYVLVYPKKTATSTNASKQGANVSSASAVSGSLATNVTTAETTEGSESETSAPANQNAVDVTSESKKEEDTSASAESKNTEEATKESAAVSESKTETTTDGNTNHSGNSSAEAESESQKDTTEKSDASADPLPVNDGDENKTTEPEIEATTPESSMEDIESMGTDNTL